MPVFSSDSTTTSIRISPTEITILKYDTQQQKIVSLFQQPIPEGTISQGKIISTEQLQAATKTAVKQARAQGDFAILGFPEDKIFSTLVNLPHVSTSDLNEAMYWQAEEALPSKLADIYFDWKNTKAADPSAQKPPKTQALIVSVPKIFIDPLIDACLKAGIKPISCEPTSLSLSRFAPKQAAIIAEVRSKDSTLTVIDQNKIIRISTVVPDPTKIVNEIKRMNNFYQTKYNTKLSGIFVCGEGANSQWQEFLKSQTGLKVSPLPLPPINNLPQDAGRYTISLALALKNPEPPKDHHTINLLPPELEKQYQTVAERKTLSFGFKVAITTTIITAIILFIGAVSIRLRIGTTRNLISQEEEITSQTPYANLAADAEAANSQARIIKRIPPKDDLLSLISGLETATPTGIIISSYTLDTPDKVLIINGVASTRGNLLNFKNRLESSEQFRLATIPLPTLERNQDIQFSIAVDIAGGK